MAAASIVITQPGNSIPVGVPGRARDDLLLGQPVVLRNANDEGVTTWRWRLLDVPLTSTAALSSSTGPQTQFVPDVAGTYLVRLEVNGATEGEVQTLVAAVPDADGNRYPAAGEIGPHANYLVSGSPNEKGWAKAVESLLRRPSSPPTAEYVIATPNADLPNARVPAPSATVGVDLSTPGVISWNTISSVASREFDFTQEPDQLIVADGTYVFGGLSWTAANVANSTVFENRHGQGLTIKAASGSSRGWAGPNATALAPGIWIDIEDLLAEVRRYRSTLELWFQFSDVSVPATSNTVIAGLWSAEGTGYSGVTVATGYRNQAGPGPMLQTSGNHAVSVDGSLANDAVVLMIPSEGTVLAYSGEYSNGWPAEDALVPSARNYGYGTTTITATHLVRRPGARLLFAVATNSSSGDPEATLRKLEIRVGPALRGH